jgi:hypothetical protein
MTEVEGVGEGEEGGRQPSVIETATTGGDNDNDGAPLLPRPHNVGDAQRIESGTSYCVSVQESLPSCLAGDLSEKPVATRQLVAIW